MIAPAPGLPHLINNPADIPLERIYDGLRHLLYEPYGPARDVALGSVLTGLLLRGPRLDEVEAAVRAALSLDDPTSSMRPAPGGVRFVGYTGSGKKTFKTFNISTCAALVAAAGGAHVAKLGSCSASSVTGSRDFMRHIGAGGDRTPVDEMIDITVRLGFGFFPIEERIPEFDSRYGGRFRAVHALSLALPALVSPVACDAVVYGLAHPAVEASAALLARFGLPDVTVLGSQVPGGGLVDEVLPLAQVRCCRMVGGIPATAPTAGLTAETSAGPWGPDAVAQRPDPRDNVAVAVRVLAGRERGAAQRAVALNAAVLLTVSGVVGDFDQAVRRAGDVLDAGAGLDLLHAFVRATGGSGRRIHTLLRNTAPPVTREDACLLATN
jgi:anthranilate phosphoribosyltransferase